MEPSNGVMTNQLQDISYSRPVKPGDQYAAAEYYNAHNNYDMVQPHYDPAPPSTQQQFNFNKHPATTRRWELLLL